MAILEIAYALPISANSMAAGGPCLLVLYAEAQFGEFMDNRRKYIDLSCQVSASQELQLDHYNDTQLHLIAQKM